MLARLVPMAAEALTPVAQRGIPGPSRAGAVVSPCGRYRYALWRRWGEGGRDLLVVGLNPSRADAHRDDPTVRRCLGYARAWGCSGLRLANLFAWRSTDPDELRRVPDPLGPDADLWLVRLAAGAGLVLAAWGNGGRLGGRSLVARRLLPPLQVLRLTRLGEPAHPLYLPASLRPLPWIPAQGE